VLNSWKDPCHLQFLAINDTTGKTIRGFNSGAFNVNPNKADTPTTWAENRATPGAVTSYTRGSPVPTPTNTQPISGVAVVTHVLDRTKAVVPVLVRVLALELVYRLALRC